MVARLRFLSGFVGLAGLLGLAACDAPGASLQITDARTYRASDKRVVVEVDLLAHERLGDNVGIYCTRVTFAGQENPFEECSADLEGGDSRTVRLVSDRELPAGAAITIRVRLDRVDVGRSLAAPP